MSAKPDGTLEISVNFGVRMGCIIQGAVRWEKWHRKSLFTVKEECDVR